MQLYSQGDIDSLRIVISRSQDDSVKVLKIDYFVAKIYRLYPDSAIDFIDKGIQIAEKIDYKNGLAKLYTKLGSIKMRKANYLIAEEYYKKSLQLYTDLANEFGIGTAYNNLALIYKYQSNFEQAINYFLLSSRIWEKRDNKKYIAITYNNLGTLYNDLRQLNKALQYHVKAAEIRRNIGDNKRLISSLNNIGLVHKEKGEYDSALSYLIKAKNLLEDFPDIYNQIAVSHNIGSVYELKGQFGIAYRYYEEAFSQSSQIKDKNSMLLASQGLGNILIKSENPKGGLRYLMQSLKIAKEIGNLYQEKELTNNIYNTYQKELPNKDSAFSYYYKYTQLKDSIFSLEKAKQIAEIQEQYETEKREHQIELLEEKNEVQRLDLARRKLISYILFGAIGIAVVLVIWFWYDNREKKKKNSILFNQKKLIEENKILIEKQRDGLQAANRTKDRMFQIIAHDLRSPLISLDNFAKLIPFWIEEEDYEALHEMSVAIDSSVSRIISLVDSLLNWAMSQQGELPYNPEEIDLYDIASEAVDLYSSFERLKKLKIECQVKKGSYVFADRNILSTVIRNLVNNAVKFTREDGEIYVGATQSKEETNIWVKDTGIGISKEKLETIFELGKEGEFRQDHGKGLGLFFCKEFVRMNKGEIFVESDKDSGTTFYFTVPTLVSEPVS